MVFSEVFNFFMNLKADYSVLCKTFELEKFLHKKPTVSKNGIKLSGFVWVFTIFSKVEVHENAIFTKIYMENLVHVGIQLEPQSSDVRLMRVTGFKEKWGTSSGEAARIGEPAEWKYILNWNFSLRVILRQRLNLLLNKLKLFTWIFRKADWR